jgi:hypothetical protein
VPSWTKCSTGMGTFRALASGTLNGIEFDKMPLSVELTMTDAVSKTYKQITSATYTPPEDIPTGLAASILANHSTLHYEGVFTLKAAEPDFTAATTNICNILPGGVDRTWNDAGSWDDGAANWDDAGNWDDADSWSDSGDASPNWTDTDNGVPGLQDINAVIESIRIVKGPKAAQTTVRIGPPRHLQAQDFIAIARATRERVTSHWSRKDPASNADGAVNVSGGTPNNNGNSLTAGLPKTAGKEEGMILILKEDDSELIPSWEDDVWQSTP